MRAARHWNRVARTIVTMVVLSVLGSMSSVRAEDVGVLGSTLTLTVDTARAKASLKSLQKDIGVQFGPAATVDQIHADLRIFYADTPSNVVTLTMPAPWAAASSTSIKFRNTPGQVRSAYVAAGKLARVTSTSVGTLDLSTPPGAGGIVVLLTIHNASDGSVHRSCSRYALADGSTIDHKSLDGKFKLRARHGVGIPCPITCDDGVHNGDETDIDCGGATCSPCATGAACQSACDCSGMCVSGICQPLVVDEGSALSSVDMGERFALRDTQEWATQYARLDEIDDVMPRRTLEEVMATSNNSGTRITNVAGVGCFRAGFKFASGDQSSCWRPQGLSGSADAYPDNGGITQDGRNLLVVSWHDDDCTWADGQPRGSRVTFVDIGNLDAVEYRKVLLVAPCDDAGSATLCPVNVHAGGTAWVDHYLYLVDTTRGLRVFDVDYMLEANTSDPIADTTLGVVGGIGYAYNYRYVLPQVGRYDLASSCGARFSWMSVDRTSTPAKLLTGEYFDASDPEPDGGRSFEWPLAADARLAADADSLTRPTSAWYIAQRRIQGGLARDRDGARKLWFTGSHSSSAYKLYRKTTTALEATYSWADGTPEGLMHSPFTGQLWSLTEFNNRPVFACNLSDVE